MEIYLIFLVVSIVLFVLSLSLWFISGLMKKRMDKESKTMDKVGGYMFFSSLLGFIVTLLIWAFSLR